MNTLPNDLLNLLSKHYNVLSMIFLTDKHLEVEDRSSSIVYQQIWPWIHYDLHTTNRNHILKAISKTNQLIAILDFITLTSDETYYIIKKSYQHGNLKIINKYKIPYTKKLKYMCILASAVGGQANLFFSIVDFTDLQGLINQYHTYIFNIIQAVYKGGSDEIITNKDFIKVVDASHALNSKCLFNLAEGGHQQRFKDTMKKLVIEDFDFSDILTKNIVCFKHFEISKYIINRMKISIIDFKQLFIKVVYESKSSELFRWLLVNFGSTIRKKKNYSLVVYECIMYNRIDFIKIMMNKQDSSDYEILELVLEKFPEIKIDHKNILEMHENGYRRICYFLKQLM